MVAVGWGLQVWPDKIANVGNVGDRWWGRRCSCSGVDGGVAVVIVVVVVAVAVVFVCCRRRRNRGLLWL